MVRERRGRKGKSKDVEEAPAPETLAVPEEPKINRYLKREKSPFEVGDRKELQVASSHAIIDKACVMDISGGSAMVAGKVDEYINLLFTDYCSLDKASCADISEVKIIIVEEESSEPVVIVPEVSIEEQEAQRKEEEERAAKEAEAARIRAEREEAERIAREEAERIAREEAEKIAAEEAEKKRIEDEEKARIAAEEAKALKKAEAEAKKKAEEEEKARKEAEEKEREEAEAAEAQRKIDEAAYDSDKDLIPVKADEPGIEWEAVEEDEPNIPPVLQDLLEEREAAAAETETESESEMTEKDRDLEWQRQRAMMRPPLVISHLKSRAVAIGQTAKLTCNVTGPGVTVRWLKNGNPIEPKAEKYKFFNSEGLLSLEVLNVKKRDAAEYTCFAKNNNGETSTVATLTVYENLNTERPSPPTFVTIKDRVLQSMEPEKPPVPEKVELDKWGDPIKKSKRVIRPLSLWAQREKFEFTVHLHNMTVVEDRNARFICGVRGGKDIEAIWHKDGRKIRFERTPRILDYSCHGATACIGIECTQPSDAGKYTCTFTSKGTNETLVTSCQMIVVPRFHKTKELAEKVPPTFVRKLQYTHKPDENQLIVHCTIFGNPEPTIRWFKEKIPLNLFNLPRYTIFNHPDDLHEHTIASLIVLGPSFLDNGDFIIEVENEAGFERRVLNVQFQTEEEYNAIYFQKYLEHKENLKYHHYQPGEQRWEDIVPEVKEFVFWEPPEDEATAAASKNKNRKKYKKKRKILKTIMTPWGDEQQVEVTDEEDSGESVYGSEEEEAEEQEEEEEEEEEGCDWNVPGEVAASDEEEEAAPAEATAEAPVAETPAAEAAQTEAEAASVEEPAAPAEEPAAVESEPPKEPTPEKEAEPVEQPPPEAEPEIEEACALPPKDDIPAEAEDGACWFDDIVEETTEYEVPSTPYKRKSPEVEHPIIINRPKYYITDFQLRKKFFFVNKLIDVEMMKGKTLRMESFSASIGPITCEWRHNGRLVKAPTARKYIEFYPQRNMTVLEIENVRVQDSGTYTVTHYNNYTEPLIDTCKVIITVPQPKETADQPPTFTRLLTDKYVERTDELTFDCHVRGYPKPEIRWYKNNLEILPDRMPRYRIAYDDDGTCTMVIVNPIRHADRGRYEVRAKNHVGEEACWLRVWFRGKHEEDDDKAEKAEYRRTQKMYKSRHVKPKDEDEWPGELYHSKRLDKPKDYDHRYKLTWLTRPCPQTLAQGSTLRLTAFVDGKYPQYEWSHNDIPLVSGRKYRQMVTNNGKGCLIINNVQPKDSGLYRLVVKNYANSIDCDIKVTVYAYEHLNFEPPLFTSTLSESYNLHHDVLTLECRVRGTPKPHIQWMKDGDYIIAGDKYEQLELPDGICKLIIARPDPEEDSGTYTCEAECNGCSDSISHNVQYEGSVENQFNRIHRYYHRDPLKPFFKTGLTDYTVPSGGSIALFIETSANCEAEWFRDRWEVDHKPPKRYVFNDGNGFFACVINHATMDESAKYMCKVTNPYGTSQSTSYVDVINPNSVGKGQKPPSFLTRPQTEIKIRAGDPFSMSFRVQAEPKARIQWYKGAREITNGHRTIKEVFNDYVRFSIKEAKESDSGIYFLVARNKHGVDRAFCQVTVKQSRTKGKDEKKVSETEAVVETADRSEKGRD